MPTQKKLLEMIAASGAAMSVLDSPECAVEQGRPAKLDDQGRLQLDDRDEVVDPGTPNRTLGDLIREAVGDSGE